MKNSCESCNTPSKILSSKKKLNNFDIPFHSFVFNSKTVLASDLKRKEQFGIPIYSEIVHKNEI